MLQDLLIIIKMKNYNKMVHIDLEYMYWLIKILIKTYIKWKKNKKNKMLTLNQLVKKQFYQIL